MEINFLEVLKSEEYNFLKENEHLGRNIILLALGGSHAYGTNVQGSDIDIRGCALNSRSDILGFGKFEQFVETKTDTTIYSFNKLIKLLVNCNPNIIEILGCKKEHYFYVHPIGEELLQHKKMFLSKKVVKSFAGYANQQLRRIENALASDNYDTLTGRNKKKDDAHLNKHAMHLIRLYLMSLDILENEEIITYRENDLALLMDIRARKYQKADKSFTAEFFEMVNSFEKKLTYAIENTSLSDTPNYERIEDFVMSVNERVVRGEY